MKRLGAFIDLPPLLREAVDAAPSPQGDPMGTTTTPPPNLGNMILWNQLRTVDRAFTKPITGKGYKGDSPNPQWMIQKATEQLGPIGQDWGFEVISEEIHEGRPVPVTLETIDEYGPPTAEGGAPVLLKRIRKTGIVHELYHQVRIRFWFKGPDGRPKGHYDAFGGTPMRVFTKSGNWQMDEDAAKKSLTDAYTKGLSWLGVAADLFLGLYDDKYQADIRREMIDVTPPQGATGTAVADQTATAPEVQSSAPKPEGKPAERKTTQPSGW